MTQKKPSTPSSSDKPSASDTPASTSETLATLPDGVTVVAAPPSSALTVAQITRLAREAAQSSELLQHIENFGARFLQLADQYPERAAQLENLATYCDSNVEGLVDERLPSIPHVMMKQALSKGAPPSAKDGTLYTKSGDMLGTELTVIPVLAHRKRTYFKPDAERPECSSDDGIVGSKHGECQHCPFGRYEEGADKKVQCSSGWAFTVLPTDFRDIYQIDFMKTSANNGKRFYNNLPRTGAFTKTHLIETSKETNKKGSYYTLQTRPTGEALSGADLDIARHVSAFVTLRYRYFRMLRNERAIARGALSRDSDAARLDGGSGSSGGAMGVVEEGIPEI